MKIICCEAEARAMGPWPFRDTALVTNKFHCLACGTFYDVIDPKHGLAPDGDTLKMVPA